MFSWKKILRVWINPFGTALQIFLTLSRPGVSAFLTPLHLNYWRDRAPLFHTYTPIPQECSHALFRPERELTLSVRRFKICVFVSTWRRIHWMDRSEIRDQDNIESRQCLRKEKLSTFQLTPSVPRSENFNPPRTGFFVFVMPVHLH